MTYRFLFSASGGYGHLHPLVPLARALRHAGHDVAFAVSPSLQPTVAAAGFTVLPVGVSAASDPEYQQVKAQLQTMPLSLESELFAYPRLFCGVATRVRAPALVAIARDWQPDMLIREAAEYAAVIAAEHLGLPHAVIAFTTALKGQAIFEREVAAQLDPIRERWGLAPDRTLTSLYRYLHLAYAPPRFAVQDVGMDLDMDVGGPSRAGAIPGATRFIRPEIFDHAGNEQLPDWITELPPQPTVYVTLGTEVNKERELYPSVLQTIITGLRDLPINLIVTLGRDKDPADFGPQPANAHIERYIPQSLLLRHCDLIVMHGGSNSLLAALDVGLPLVVVPLIADQFFNARIIQDMRLGPGVERWRLSADSIRAAVGDALDNPTYQQNVARLQAEMHALPGQEYAVALIERVAAEREPVLSKGWTPPS
jgi:UDP:flavonoid glycosyltransferase YjiC (YdhE family)